MGEIDGLGNITSIPKAGWATQVIAMERHGYIAWVNGIYYRLYLSTYNTEKALVKYQRPFLGTETEIIPTKTTVLFEKEASYQEIAFLNKTLFPEVESVISNEIVPSGSFIEMDSASSLLQPVTMRQISNRQIRNVAFICSFFLI